MALRHLPFNDGQPRMHVQLRIFRLLLVTYNESMSKGSSSSVQGVPQHFRFIGLGLCEEVFTFIPEPNGVLVTNQG